MICIVMHAIFTDIVDYIPRVTALILVQSRNCAIALDWRNEKRLAKVSMEGEDCDRHNGERHGERQRNRRRRKCIISMLWRKTEKQKEKEMYNQYVMEKDRETEEEGNV